MSLFGQQSTGSSLFSGSNNPQPNSSNLFAQPAASNAGPQPVGGGLFGSASTSQPQQSGGLFGSTSAAASSQQTGGLFGSLSTTAQPQQTSSSLPFGSTTTTTSSSQPQQSTSLFGGAQGQAQNQNVSQPTGGLFGPAQSTQNQQTGGSLFGGSIGQNSAQPQNQASQSGGGLFAHSTASQTKPTLSLFNNTTSPQTQYNRPQQQQQPSLFAPSSNSLASPLSSPHLSTAQRLPGTLTMGQSTSQSQTTVPGVRIDVSNLRGTTRFNDLHEDLQKQIEMIDAFVQQQISFKEQCDALMPAHEQNLSTVPGDVEFVKTKLEMAENTLANDGDAINAMKQVTQQDIDDARIGFRAVENLKLPQQFHYTGIWRPSATTISPPRGSSSADQTSGASASTETTDLVGYFNKQTQQLLQLLSTYTQNVSEIETHLGAVEATAVAQSQQLMFRQRRDGGTRSKEDQVAELAAVLRQFESGILGVAEKVGQARENVVDVIAKNNETAVFYRR